VDQETNAADLTPLKFRVSNGTITALEQEPTWAGGALYARLPSCFFLLEDAYLVATTLYTNILAPNRYAAFHCTHKEQQFYRETGFNKTFKLKRTVFLPVSSKRCDYMVTHNVTAKYQPLRPFNDSMRRTDNHLIIEQSSFLQDEAMNHTVTNFYYEKVNLTLNIETGFMESETLNMNRNCTYRQSYCSTQFRITIWNVPYEANRPSSCSLGLKRDNSCLVNRHGLICPTLGFSFFDHTLEDKFPMCGRSFGYGISTIQAHSNMDLDGMNQLDSTMNVRLHTRFIHLYDQLNKTVSQPSFISIIHIGACNQYVSQFNITK